MQMIEEVKAELASGMWTLVVGNQGIVRHFTNRGVADLARLLEQEPGMLHGASVADKIVGKGAAALMVMGHVAELYTPRLTGDAAAMLRSAGVKISFDRIISKIDNADGTGRCPIDAMCAALSEPSEMVWAISRYLSTHP